MIVLDTGGLLALLHRGEREHRRAQAIVKKARGPLVVTDFVLAETDYLVLTRLGAAAERAFVRQVVQGAFLREPVTLADLERTSEILEEYGDQELGLTDATLLAVCDRLEVRDVLTTDRRHFAPYRNPRGDGLRLLLG